VGACALVREKDVLKELGITHIINCTKDMMVPRYCCFEYLELGLDNIIGQEIVQHFNPVFTFIRDAITHKGKVLICSKRGLSRAPALAIAHIMDIRALTYYEAMIFVKNRRYVIDLNPGFITQLCRYSFEQSFIRVLSQGHFQYQCLCGAVTFTLIEPLLTTDEKPNPRPCSCKPGNDSSFCPYNFCQSFLNEMRTLYNYNCDSVKWGSTTAKNLINETTLDAIEANPIKYSDPSVKVTKKEWNVYKCKTCHFLTHAKLQQPQQTEENTMCIVTNISASFDPKLGVLESKNFFIAPFS